MPRSLRRPTAERLGHTDGLPGAWQTARRGRDINSSSGKHKARLITAHRVIVSPFRFLCMPDSSGQRWISKMPFSGTSVSASSQTRPSVTQHHSSRLPKTALQLTQNLVLLGAFATVTVFVVSTPWAQTNSDQGLPLNDFLKLDQSIALAVVTASQTVLGAAVGAALNDAFDCLQWHLMGGRGGLEYPTALALSSTTGSLGTLALLVAPLSRVGIPAKLWALLRYEH